MDHVKTLHLGRLLMATALLLAAALLPQASRATLLTTSATACVTVNGSCAVGDNVFQTETTTVTNGVEFTDSRAEFDSFTAAADLGTDGAGVDFIRIILTDASRLGFPFVPPLEWRFTNLSWADDPDGFIDGVTPVSDPAGLLDGNPLFTQNSVQIFTSVGPGLSGFEMRFELGIDTFAEQPVPVPAPLGLLLLGLPLLRRRRRTGRA